MLNNGVLGLAWSPVAGCHGRWVALLGEHFEGATGAVTHLGPFWGVLAPGVAGFQAMAHLPSVQTSPDAPPRLASRRAAACAALALGTTYPRHALEADGFSQSLDIATIQSTADGLTLKSDARLTLH